MGDRKLDLTAASYVFHNNSVLFIFHSKLKMWLPPGGHIDQNESPDAAAVREVLEEVNLKVNVLDAGLLDLTGQVGVAKQTPNPFYTNIHSVGDHDHWGACYICESDTDKVTINKESKEYSWLTKEEVSNHPEIRKDIKQITLHAFDIYNALKKRTNL